MTTTASIKTFPWQPDSTATADLAINTVRERLMSALKDHRGIHTETLLTAVGSLAGFAAQNAALARVTSNDSSAPRLSFAIVLTQSGEKWVMGDAVNVFLYPEPHSILPIYSILAGAAIKAGVAEGELPNIGEMAGYRAKVVGTPDFYKLRAPPDHQPLNEPLALLRRLWPLARDILSQPPQKKLFRAAEKPLQETYWPIILSIVGSQLIEMTKAILNPRISTSLAMESAIIFSKIDPETIEPGKWRIDTGETAQSIARLRK
jgi:hypothetical protein